MGTLANTLEDFKKGVAEFIKASRTADAESLDHGWKAVGIMYLDVAGLSEYNQIMAPGVLNLAQKYYLSRLLELK
jgi:hypothetical protein